MSTKAFIALLTLAALVHVVVGDVDLMREQLRQQHLVMDAYLRAQARWEEAGHHGQAPYWMVQLELDADNAHAQHH